LFSVQENITFLLFFCRYRAPQKNIIFKQNQLVTESKYHWHDICFGFMQHA